MKPLHDQSSRGFASDNYAGVHPEVLAAIADANDGHQIAYGEDVYTARLVETLREHFGAQAEAFPVFNGTGAQCHRADEPAAPLGRRGLTSTAHIHSDEGGAPEKVAGLKLFTVDTPDGKLTPRADRDAGRGASTTSTARQPAAVSITQTTELGTLYTPGEIRAIADYAHANGMSLHLDGARIWNAAAALGVPFREFTTDAGVDVLELRRHQERAPRRRSDRGAQPRSRGRAGATAQDAHAAVQKMRFMSAQLLALFDGGLGLASAGHANAMAARLRGALEELVGAGDAPGLSFSQPTQANAVFAVLPNDAADRIRARYRFYDWDRAAGQVRWMTAFDTTEADVDGFVEAIREELAR